MRKLFAACCAVLLVGAAWSKPVRGQERPGARADTVLNTRSLPPEVEREVTDAFNSPNTVRTTGPYEVPAGEVVTGDMAVLNGPVTIAGRVTGRVVAINSDVVLRPGARVEGQILVVGGDVIGRDEAFVGGDVRTYRQVLAYRREGDRLVASASEEDASWWRRRQRGRSRSYSDLRLLSARTYNRVEGLPIYIGPSFGRRLPSGGRLTVDAFGIFRTGESIEWNSDNVGHSLRAELSLGRGPGIAIGGRVFDVVDAAEAWQLSDTEVGLASFLLHRDFRDYYARHGGSGYVRFTLVPGTDITASLSDERWRSRETLDPFTLFRNSQSWRLNPSMDEGRFHVANATLRIDTRNDVDDPRSGWYLSADFERGSGRTTSLGFTSPGVRDDAVVGEKMVYNRGFLDLRRYNRLSPEGQLNFRFVAGGWLSGDELPLQRRLSVGGPGTLPGYPFRRTGAGEDLRQCSNSEIPAGVPAQCERMMLVQAEYRGDLWVSLFGDLDDSWRRGGWEHRTQWVVFADAGRGWLVGPRSGDLQYPKGSIPSLGTFRTDVGIGFDAGLIGIYLAKSVSDSKEPPNLFIRIGQRF